MLYFQCLSLRRDRKFHSPGFRREDKLAETAGAYRLHESVSYALAQLSGCCIQVLRVYEDFIIINFWAGDGFVDKIVDLQRIARSPN